MAKSEARRRASPACLDALRARFGARVSTAAAILESHGRDESYHAVLPPDAVVFPQSVEEIAAIVGIAREHRTPIIPFGAGTSLEGHIAALSGGITVDMTRMNRLLEVNAEDLDVRVEAGVTRIAPSSPRVTSRLSRLWPDRTAA